MMKRDTCLRVLARYRTDEIVVAVYQAAQEWLHISPSDLNYTFTDAMGQGSSHALGLALGRMCATSLLDFLRVISSVAVSPEDNEKTMRLYPFSPRSASEHHLGIPHILCGLSQE